jgi:tight adherence protein C
MTVSFVLMIIGTFVVVTAIVLSGYYTVTAESVVAQRLRTLVPEAATGPRARRVAGVPRPGLMTRLLTLLGQYGPGGHDSSLVRMLSVAGIRGTSGTLCFLGARTLVSFGPALAILVTGIASPDPVGRTLILGAFAWANGHIGANLLLKRRAGRRVRRITDALPDCLDLMVVCLESGLGLNATITRVGEERAHMNDPLGNEFSQLALELREGRSREEALRAFGARNGVDDLKALAALIIQSDRLGASMSKTLRAHADLVRVKRRQRAEEASRKLPVKMLIPLALFILPPLFIMTTGPALLTLKDLFKTIGQG